VHAAFPDFRIDLVNLARASPAAHSGQLSAFSSDCVDAGLADFDHRASSPVKRNRTANFWRKAQSTMPGELVDFFSPCEETQDS
jgi:hypothetical protein